MKMNVRWTEIYDKLCGLVPIILAICLLGFVFVYSAVDIFDKFYGIDRIHHELMERKHQSVVKISILHLNLKNPILHETVWLLKNCLSLRISMK